MAAVTFEHPRAKAPTISSYRVRLQKLRKQLFLAAVAFEPPQTKELTISGCRSL